MRDDFRLGDWLVQPSLGRISRSGQAVQVRAKVIDLVVHFARHPGDVIAKDDLLRDVWGTEDVSEAALTRTIAELRQAFGDDVAEPRILETIPKRGYRLIAPVAGLTEHGPVPGGRSRMKMAAVAAIASLATLAAVAVALAIRQGSRSKPLTPELLNIDLPADAPFASVSVMRHAGDKPALAISPDGSLLAYVGQLGGGTRIVIRDMMTGKTSPLAGTENGDTPFFSPDGASIAFFAAGRLKKIPLAAGAVVGLADAPNGWGGVWAPDDAIYFSGIEVRGIVKISAGGGPLEVVYGHPGVVMPGLLPSGGLLASSTSGALVTSGSLGGSVLLVSGGKARELLPSGFGARYVETGHLVYALPGKLMAVRFDTRGSRVTGSPVVIVPDLRTGPVGVAQFALSASGTLVYAAGRDQEEGSFVWADREGRTTPVGLPTARYGPYSVSPDGTRLAVSIPTDAPGGGSDIWIYGLETPGRTVRFTRGPGRSINTWPRWTRDGRHVVYWNSPETGEPRLVVAPADQTGPVTTLWSRTKSGLSYLYPMSFSPDGSLLAAFGPGADGKWDMYTLVVSGLDGSSPGASPPRPLVQSAYADAFPQFSPDGRAIAYLSDESSQYEIYVTAYPGPGPRCRVSRGPATDPSWMPDGRSVVYMSGTAIVEAEVKSVARCDIGAPRVLFTGAYPDLPGFGHDMTADGRILLFENKSVLTPTTTLNAITNFFDELRRRLPVQ